MEKFRIENIEIDQVAIVEKFAEDIMWKSKREQLEATREFLRKNLKNALNPKEKVPDDIQKRIWDQDKTKTLSTVFNDKYGVCVEWHVVGQVVLNKVGMETVFKTGYVGGVGHTYLDVKIDKKWEIFDPFAEKFLEDIGQKGSTFQDEYYKDSTSKNS
ncbi:MAG: hypothetical protein NT068_03395 [Candidatus Nomurabacteria bacterium]|nr:hypothetical protein [Candidatus Nomurabacteria bacterium]